MQGRPLQYSDLEIIRALRKHRGMLHIACKAIGCNPRTILKRARASPRIMRELRWQRGLAVDNAESQLMKAVDNSQPWAITLTLKTIGKKRGYVERTEHRVGGDQDAPPIRHEALLCQIPLELRESILDAMLTAQESNGSTQTIIEAVQPKRRKPRDLSFLPGPVEEPGIVLPEDAVGQDRFGEDVEID